MGYRHARFGLTMPRRLMTSMIGIARVMGPLALFALNACAVGPDYRPATSTQLGVPAKFVSGAPLSARPDLATWWERFSDPVLTELEKRALANNLDIAQAADRLKQARGSLIQSSAQQLPNVGLTVSAGRNFNHGVPDTNNLSDQIDAQWSADLFGGLRRGTEASRAALEASGYSLVDVQTSIAAEVARNYVDARSLNARIIVARDTLRTQDDNFEIAGFRAQAGLVSSIDVEQARAQRAQTAATIPALVKSEAAARNRLSVLTGQAPGAVDTLFASEAPIPAAPLTLTVGMPADTLRQRPDVRVAERNLAAATARIGVAQAQLYPSLTVTGSVGSSATSLGGLTDFVTGNVFASLAHTIFDGGNRRSAVRARRAAADESFAAYKSAVLRALEDIENALASLDSAKTRAGELAIQVEASNNAAILARSNYRAGLADFRTLLEAERSLLSARDGLASAEGDQATAVIQLYLALGGGWTPDAPIATNP